MLAAPFIAAVQVIVYAGAIMVLVVFVIMLLNVEQEEKRRIRMGFLVPAGIGLAAALIAEVTFLLAFVESEPLPPSDIGLTKSIGPSLFTQYLLPFEITSVLLLMAIVGAMTLARRTGEISGTARIVPGDQMLALSEIDPTTSHEEPGTVEAHTTTEAARVLGITDLRDQTKRD